MKREATFNYPKCSDQLCEVMDNGGLHFLNTSIIPPGADGIWTVEEIEPAFVRHCLSYLGHSGAWGFATSHIGHEATAAVASELFNTPLQMDRTPWDGSGVGIALQLKGRLPEGMILNRDDLEAMGFTVRALFKPPQRPYAPLPKQTVDDLAEYALELVYASGVGQTASPREPSARAKKLYAQLTGA